MLASVSQLSLKGRSGDLAFSACRFSLLCLMSSLILSRIPSSCCCSVFSDKEADVSPSAAGSEGVGGISASPSTPADSSSLLPASSSSPGASWSASSSSRSSASTPFCPAALPSWSSATTSSSTGTRTSSHGKFLSQPSGCTKRGSKLTTTPSFQVSSTLSLHSTLCPMENSAGSMYSSIPTAPVCPLPAHQASAVASARRISAISTSLLQKTKA
mmetsp:Transcript_63931/g.116692  ORF Transcript_63931/g.116692 Transcript_63931/m.116692 type:complete len:215 (+) Transcript_63931:737-1381(+)